MDAVGASRDRLNLGVFLDSAVTADVQRLHAALGEHAADEKVAVAAGRVLLAAHHGDAAARTAVDQAFDPLQEVGALGDAPVKDVAVGVVERRFARPSAELVAQVDVLYCRCFEGIQLLPYLTCLQFSLIP